MKRTPISLADALHLTGCGEHPSKTSEVARISPEHLVNSVMAPTVVWFLENPEALESTWKLNRTNPGEHGLKGACVNAGAAYERVLVLGRARVLNSMKH